MKQVFTNKSNVTDAINKTDASESTGSGLYPMTADHGDSGVSKIQVSSTINNTSPYSVLDTLKGVSRSDKSERKLINIQPSKLNNSGIYAIKKNESRKADLKVSAGCRQDYSVITDGDDIFNLPTGKCAVNNTAAVIKPDKTAKDRPANVSINSRCKEDFYYPP